MDNNEEYLTELILSKYYAKIGGAISPGEFLTLALGIGKSHGHLVCVDYNDISLTMHGADRIDAQSGITTPHDIGEAARDLYDRLLSFHRGETLAKLLINIDINKSGEVKVDHISSLTEFISGLPNTVDIIWGISFDENLSNNEVRVNEIVNFKL